MNSLHLAIQTKHLDIVKYLVDKSSYPRDFVNSCRTDGAHKSLSPLHVAIRAGDLEIVKFLIEKGADPKSPDFNGDTTVIQACLAEQPEVMRYLVQKELSHVDDKGHGGRTSLSVLAEMNRDDDIEWLIDNGADASIKVGGKTAWEIAYRDRKLLALSAFAQKDMEQELEQFYIDNPGENDEPRTNPPGSAQPDGNFHVPTSDDDKSVKYILQNLRRIDIDGLETDRRVEVPWYHLNGNNVSRIFYLSQDVLH
jgi:Ankyrin repeats (3 copies)